jgi:D-cysteine desulfhydrase
VEQVKVVPAGAPMLEEMAAVAGELAAAGRKGYVIPGGGSNPLGALGYVACAQEILAQTFELGLDIHAILCASGSAGTQAGLVIGVQGCSMNLPVLGINVSRTKQAQEALVYGLVQATAEHVGLSAAVLRETVVCFEDYVGPGYSLPTPGMAEAVRLLARTEGILLDPVYTGKAMAGLIDLVKKGYFERDSNILFIHTGGLPALYVYQEYF